MNVIRRVVSSAESNQAPVSIRELELTTCHCHPVPVGMCLATYRMVVATNIVETRECSSRNTHTPHHADSKIRLCAHDAHLSQRSTEALSAWDNSITQWEPQELVPTDAYDGNEQERSAATTEHMPSCNPAARRPPAHLRANRDWKLRWL
eukprot:scaffold127580_cov41-Tisochrysis_lutea.AAC.2